MKEELRYTLVAEGSSDRALLPVLSRILRETGKIEVTRGTYADFSRTRRPKDFQEKLTMAVALFPCDLLFVHRDADRHDAEFRYVEIKAAAKAAWGDNPKPLWLCVVPVRMQEAWLLFDEAAIREASGNPNGTVQLSLPPTTKFESIPDPKAMLHAALRTASGRQKRRLKSFDVYGAAALVSEYVSDFSPLRDLPAFQRLENDVWQLIAAGWRT